MKKWLTIAFSAVLTVGFLVMTALFLDSKAYGDSLEAENTVLREQAAANTNSIYLSLINDLNDMQTALSKLDAAATPALSVRLLADVWRLSSSAVDALSRLPAAHGDAMGLNQFLVRSGDYAYTLLVAVQDGVIPSETDAKQLHALSARCGELSSAVETALSDGTLPTEYTDADGFYSETEEEESIANYPTLLYDGPFSESSEQAEPLGLGEDTVLEADALKTLRALFPDLAWVSDGRTEGKIATFDFSCTDAAGECSASVTEQGGLLLSLLRQPSSDLDDPPSDAESEALHQVAEAFLAELGYEQMHPSYAQYYNGAVVFNYAATQDGVILYADLVKVTVDRSTKTVIGLDARNYLFSHHTRALAAPLLTEQDAKDAVSAALTLDSVALALIPISNTKEILCYECKGHIQDTFYIVYIDAISGAEVELYEIINSDEGDLVV